MLHRALLPVMVVSSLVAPQEATTSSAVEKELRQRTRRIFQRDSSGAVTGFVDRREGHDIVWRKVRWAPRTRQRTAGRKVKNLDFTTESGRATLGS